MNVRLMTFTLLATAAIAFSASAQTDSIAATVAPTAPEARVDTIYNPNVVFTGMPKKYTIAGIKVTGVPNFEDYIVIGYSGLSIGQEVEIPGNDIKNAAKRFWKQGLFSKVQIKVEKTAGDKVWLEFALRPQPRISQIKYNGVKKGEKEDLEARLNLNKGNQFTQNIAQRAEIIVRRYFDSKGFKNADVSVNQYPDISKENEVIVEINVVKHDKVKVHKIYITGNENLSDRTIKNAMKKTNENNNLLNLFKQKKFVPSDYENDKQLIIDKYNEKGYRDARIVADSVVNYNENRVDVYITVEEGRKYYIDKINWVGNTLYSSDYLDAVLGIPQGSVYNQKLLNKRTTEDDDAVSNLYMNRGYLFYSLVPIETNVRTDSLDIEMHMVEGPQARINKVVINGNDRLYEKVVRRELRVKPGELFSKADLIRSAREIAQTGHFDPEKMDIRPEPDAANGTVDLLFNLTSKANDQFEISAGWGQTGIIGRVGIKFTNFSIANLFHPSRYRGIIPQGDGQTLSLSVQTNARYYQQYSISFIDPWFGGKRPNSFSVSAFYSRQTGVNSSYYNSNWANGTQYAYGYNGYNYNGYGYNSDYYQSAIENAYDPHKFLQMIGVTVGFGKRLSWPDDYFTFTAELGYQWYYLKNWEYLYYMNNGVSNSLTLGLTLARNSIDNPLFTRRGSQFSLNLQLTPPASLFGGNKDWKALSEANTTQSKQELYRWIEYWKLRFKSRTYTPLINPDGQYTLVLMTRADFGLLGSYHKYLKSPFETFYVGGDGMSGSYTYATETIGLRGYENGAFTPWGSEGYAYCRYVAELHFPFLLQTSTTIYGLAFAEAGNAWTSVSKFSPFNVKRSAGLGVRIFLPMIGMMGIDWAYGFDKVFGTKGGSNFHFILGQEF